MSDHYVQVFDQLPRDIVTGKLAPNDVAVFALCASLLEWEGEYVVHPETGQKLTINALAALAHWDRGTVTRALSKLATLEYVVIEEKSTRTRHIRVNPRMAYRGRYNKRDRRSSGTAEEAVP
jgi:DNA-binding transcriptional regulator YhcF (GntR family)